MLRLKASYLISVTTSIKGGVEYHRVELEHTSEGSRQTERWETKKVIRDVEEHEAASEARKNIRNKLASCCATTPFGLICQEGDYPKMEEAIKEANRIRDEFNAGATSTRLRVSILPVRFTTDDAEAVRSIRRETERLLGDLERATRAGDPEEIRKVTADAVQMSRVIDEDSPVAPAVADAVKEARQVARQVRARVIKKGEELETVLSEQTFAAVTSARQVLDDMGDVETATAPVEVGRAILDLPPQEQITLSDEQVAQILSVPTRLALPEGRVPKRQPDDLDELLGCLIEDTETTLPAPASPDPTETLMAELYSFAA